MCREHIQLHALLADRCQQILRMRQKKKQKKQLVRIGYRENQLRMANAPILYGLLGCNVLSSGFV